MVYDAWSCLNMVKPAVNGGWDSFRFLMTIEIFIEPNQHPQLVNERYPNGPQDKMWFIHNCLGMTFMLIIISILWFRYEMKLVGTGLGPRTTKKSGLALLDNGHSDNGRDCDTLPFDRMNNQSSWVSKHPNDLYRLSLGFLTNGFVILANSTTTG